MLLLKIQRKIHNSDCCHHHRYSFELSTYETWKHFEWNEVLVRFSKWILNMFKSKPRKNFAFCFWIRSYENKQWNRNNWRWIVFNFEISSRKMWKKPNIFSSFNQRFQFEVFKWNCLILITSQVCHVSINFPASRYYQL